MSALLLLLLPTALALQPRQPLRTPPVRLPPLEQAWGVELSVKLRDELQGRPTADGRLRSASGRPLDALQALATRHGAHFAPLVDLPPQRLEALRDRAQARTGRAAADLQGMLRVLGPTDPVELLALAQQLQASPLVEYAVLRPVGTPPPGLSPPPEDLGSPTADFSAAQGYLDADPGIDAWAAWDLGNLGAGVQLSDVEYGWELGHEDLVDKEITLEPGQSIPQVVIDYGYDQHGTAVLGELMAVPNDYGCTGGAPDLLARVYPEYSEAVGSRRVEAIAAAAADSVPGDIIVLEMQLDLRASGAYGPAELDPDVWTAVKTATDAGVVVIAAAGNGDEDLDSAWYAENYLAWGDSGAILVGAGSADLEHEPMVYSTHGERVDLQGWGEQVVTLGYGDLAFYDGDTDQRYTGAFSGTSSATPIVAAAAALVQSQAVIDWGERLTPTELRQLLIDSGIPQGEGVHVGPLPDVLAASAALDDDADGYRDLAYGGDDCEDDHPDAFPGGAETWYDGIDGDCLGDDDYDADADGWTSADYGGDDCDDTDPLVSPDASELEGDGLDNDCDPDTPDEPSDDDDELGKVEGCSTAPASWPLSGLILGVLAPLLRRRRDAADRRG